MNIIIVSAILFGAIPTVVSEAVRVKGQLRGNASVHCSYKKGYENSAKYFNKGKPETQLVRLGRGERWARSSRFSLEDDKENREFIVTIRNLSVEDAGLYWCGVMKWGQALQTEINLDVVQDATTENDSVFETSSSATITRQRTAEPQNLQATVRDRSVHLGVSLAGVLLLCATASVMVIIIMKNNKAGASTQCGKYTEPEVDKCVYAKVTLKNRASSDSIIYATPTPSRTWPRSTPSHCGPAANVSGGTRLQTPKEVVYSVILSSQPRPQWQSHAVLSNSTQSISHLYSELDFEQRSQLRDTSAFSEESHVVYATVHQN